MAIDPNAGHVLPGMVCAWWYDGDRMFEPARMTECRIAAMDDMHPDWPNDGMGIGGGAVIPIHQGRPIFWNGPRPEQDVAFLQNRPKLGTRAARVFPSRDDPLVASAEHCHVCK